MSSDWVEGLGLLVVTAAFWLRLKRVPSYFLRLGLRVLRLRLTDA